MIRSSNVSGLWSQSKIWYSLYYPHGSKYFQFFLIKASLSILHTGISILWEDDNDSPGVGVSSYNHGLYQDRWYSFSCIINHCKPSYIRERSRPCNPSYHTPDCFCWSLPTVPCYEDYSHGEGLDWGWLGGGPQVQQQEPLCYWALGGVTFTGTHSLTFLLL